MKAIRVLVFGGHGWIGSLISKRLPMIGNFNVLPTDANILSTMECRKVVQEFEPDMVINAAGVCGKRNIDDCEIDENAKRLTMAVNGYGPRILYDIVGDSWYPPIFVHLSSGCLWDNPYDLTPIGVSQIPKPNSWYSHTKVVGEQGLSGTNAIIFRIRMPIDDIPNPRNLINKLASYNQVLDVPNSVTQIDHLIDRISRIPDTADFASFKFNIVSGTLTGHEIMTAYKKWVNPEHQFQKITLEELYSKGLVKTGRSNCILSSGMDVGTFGSSYIFQDHEKDKFLENLMTRYKKNLNV